MCSRNLRSQKQAYYDPTRASTTGVPFVLPRRSYGTMISAAPKLRLPSNNMKRRISYAIQMSVKGRRTQSIPHVSNYQRLCVKNKGILPQCVIAPSVLDVATLATMAPPCRGISTITCFSFFQAIRSEKISKLRHRTREEVEL